MYSISLISGYKLDVYTSKTSIIKPVQESTDQCAVSTVGLCQLNSCDFFCCCYSLLLTPDAILFWFESVRPPSVQRESHEDVAHSAPTGQGLNPFKYTRTNTDTQRPSH